MSFQNAVSQQPGQITLSPQLPSWSPHSYQETGIKLLLGQGAAALFLDPGLGKTTICLASFKILKKLDYAKKMLVVAPLRPCYKVWPEEIKKWAEFRGLTYTILHGKDKQKNLESDVDFYIINPEGLAWLFAPNQLKRPQFDILCIDESSKFKNSTTQRFKLLKPLLPSFARRWILTGTPVPNGLTDLFGQIYILDMGASLGRYITHYRREFFDQSGYGGYDYIPKSDAFARIVERIKPLVLQLSAEDHLNMPEMICQNIVVDLPSETMKLYKQIEDAFYAEMDGIAGTARIVAANAAVAGGKCRQIANGAVYSSLDTDIPGRVNYSIIHEEKLDALEDLIEQLGGKPLLVLYEFQHDRERILKRFPGAEVLGSGISMKRTDDIIDRFNAGKIQLLLGHPDSMGHGLNLQGSCHHVCWFGITWNLDFHDQANARVYRQGQRADSVFIYYLVASGTLDEKVLKVLTAKDRTQQSLLNALGES
jgi:SNF2 family DNA or RNA helicase